MNKVLLDTDIYSEILKGADTSVVRRAVDYRERYGHLTLSVITVMEIVQGLQRIDGERRLRIFREAVILEEVLPFDMEASTLAGQIAGNLDRIGKPIGRCDPMIAAIAVARNMELVTGNMRHYQRIRDIGYPLLLANWRV